MGLFDTLQNDLKEAMRARDVTTRETLRMTISALKNRRIELGRELEEEETLQVLTKAVKSRQDSATQYDEAGRSELADQERAEIEVIQRYLPQPLSADEVRAAVQRIIEENGLSSKKELGKLMKLVMAEYRGRVDGKAVQGLAAELLD